uniref:MH2 domain-containing protein n=1 Tax=Scylla olivacea TaxID=85551 RepID=A0A0P4WGB5_SCYOL
MKSHLQLGGGSCSVPAEVQRGTVKTKNLWRSRRRWAQAAAMEIFECVDCFQSRPRVRVRQPRPPSESPPPPYSRFSSDLLRPEDDAPSEDSPLESQETGGTTQFPTGSVPWCQVAYWEGRERVGRLYPVCSSSLNIMGDTPHGDGLSLASLAAHSHTSPSEQVKRTREKIGLGRYCVCVWCSVMWCQ